MRSTGWVKECWALVDWCSPSSTYKMTGYNNYGLTHRPEHVTEAGFFGEMVFQWVSVYCVCSFEYSYVCLARATSPLFLGHRAMSSSSDVVLPMFYLVSSLPPSPSLCAVFDVACNANPLVFLIGWITAQCLVQSAFHIARSCQSIVSSKLSRSITKVNLEISDAEKHLGLPWSEL